MPISTFLPNTPEPVNMPETGESLPPAPRVRRRVRQLTKRDRENLLAYAGAYRAYVSDRRDRKSVV